MNPNAATKRGSRSNRTTIQTQPSQSGPQLNFQIDRITLHGYAPNDQARFVNSLKQCLTSLAPTLQPFSLARVSRKLAFLDAGQLRAGASPEEAARHTARRIFAVLNERKRGDARV
jgi:hypothetical protein